MGGTSRHISTAAGGDLCTCHTGCVDNLQADVVVLKQINADVG